MRGVIIFLTLVSIALSAFAQVRQVRITEAMVNPPGSPDRGREFIEIQSCRPNFSLQGYWLIGIDGESLFNPGNIHWAVDLSSYSTGANGLLLVRDGEAVLQPAPASGTTVVVINNAFTEAAMGNDTYTVALVRGFSGRPGDDIDQNNDGTIDNVLWTEAVDAFGWSDDEVAPGEFDAVYSTQLNGVDVPPSLRRRADGSTWEPDVVIFFQNGSLIAADAGRAPNAGDFGPFLTSTTNLAVLNPPLPTAFNRQVTPGNLNPGDLPAVAGDANCDRCVNNDDLLIVLFAFGGSDTNADLNDDGTVNNDDLLLVLFNFGQGC